MSGYFLVILFLWVLIVTITKIFSLQILPAKNRHYYIVALLLVFLLSGFLVDWIAINQEWYTFPQTTKYLWMTPIGVPIEEAFFFLTVPVWTITLWKLVKKLVN